MSKQLRLFDISLIMKIWCLGHELRILLRYDEKHDGKRIKPHHSLSYVLLNIYIISKRTIFLLYNCIYFEIIKKIIVFSCKVYGNTGYNCILYFSYNDENRWEEKDISLPLSYAYSSIIYCTYMWLSKSSCGISHS